MAAESFKEIVESIVATHHSFLRRELPKLSDSIVKLESENGNNVSLVEARQLFEKIRSKIEAHLHDEETLLFPTGIALEAGSAPPESGIDLIERLKEMEKEHDGCTNSLGIVCQLLSGLSQSQNLERVQASLQSVQSDLLVHVEKENLNVHPRFIELFLRKDAESALTQR